MRRALLSRPSRDVDEFNASHGRVYLVPERRCESFLSLLLAVRACVQNALIHRGAVSEIRITEGGGQNQDYYSMYKVGQKLSMQCGPSSHILWSCRSGPARAVA